MPRAQAVGTSLQILLRATWHAWATFEPGQGPSKVRPFCVCPGQDQARGHCFPEGAEHAGGGSTGPSRQPPRSSIFPRQPKSSHPKRCNSFNLRRLPALPPLRPTLWLGPTPDHATSTVSEDTRSSAGESSGSPSARARLPRSAPGPGGARR